MSRSVVALTLIALFAIGCPGPRPPVQAGTGAPLAGGPERPLVWKMSKSGLGFRISNADDEADGPPERKIVAATPLAAEDARRIKARLPELKVDRDDEKSFALRDKSIPAPRSGKTVT